MFWRKRKPSDFAAEIEAHLELETEQLKEQGLSEEEARRAARRAFGNLTRAEERFYESGRWLWWDHLVQDLRFGLRMLRKNPGFTAVAVLTLALGIGANTAIFSLLNAVMLRELPVEKPEQLMLLGRGRAGGSSGEFASTELYSYPFYREMRQKNQVFSDVSAMLSLLFTKMHGAVGGSAELEPMDVQLVSGSYFPLLGVKPILGRSFTEAEDEPAGGHPVAMVSYSWWNRRFARDPSLVGKTVTLGPTVYTIIGITPPGFFGTTVGESPDLWIPLSMEKQVSPGWNGLDDKSFQSLYILGRLKSRRHDRAGSSPGQPPGQSDLARLCRSHPYQAARGRPSACSDRTDFDKAWTPAHSLRCRNSARNPDGRRGTGLADRLRQPREPPTGARHDARARNRSAHVARSRQGKTDPPNAYREPGARPGRRDAGNRVCRVGGKGDRRHGSPR